MGSALSLTLETETKTPEEIGKKSIKDQSLQITDQPKEKSSNVNNENEKVSTSSSSKTTLESETKTPEEIGGEEKKDDDDEEEEEECGFCLFMKSGGCKETFVAWENCIEAVEKEKGDIVEKCFEVTSALRKCMEEHPDHYGPILQAEKAAEQEVRNELEKRKLEEEEEKKANKSVDKEAILEVEKDGVANEAVVET